MLVVCESISTKQVNSLMKMVLMQINELYYGICGNSECMIKRIQ